MDAPKQNLWQKRGRSEDSPVAETRMNSVARDSLRGGQRTYDHAITEFVAWRGSQPRPA